MKSFPSNSALPASFRAIIGLWPATRGFARDAGCSTTLVRQWRHRNFIPPQYWRGIVEAAARRKIAGIDAELLARLAAAARGREGPSHPYATLRPDPQRIDGPKGEGTGK